MVTRDQLEERRVEIVACEYASRLRFIRAAAEQIGMTYGIEMRWFIDGAILRAPDLSMKEALVLMELEIDRRLAQI